MSNVLVVGIMYFIRTQSVFSRYESRDNAAFCSNAADRFWLSCSLSYES